jgi:hypothetical protein
MCIESKEKGASFFCPQAACFYETYISFLLIQSARAFLFKSETWFFPLVIMQKRKVGKFFRSKVNRFLAEGEGLSGADFFKY